MRTTGGKPMKNGGEFFAFDEKLPKPILRPQPERPPAPDFGMLMRRWSKEEQSVLTATAAELGVSERSLRWLGAAWSDERSAMAIPMHDATYWNASRPIGIRLRLADGKKLAVTGSTSGIFVPYGALRPLAFDDYSRVFVCEGPTDTAAALELGYFSLGRAACRGGEELILRALDDIKPQEVVLVTDNDGPGVAGARDLMRHIKQPKRMLTPPSKDLRSFVQNGGTKGVVESLLNNIVRR